MNAASSHASAGTFQPGARARELFEAASRAMPGGNTRSTLHVNPSPPYANEAFGATIVDVDGHELIDGLNNFTALVHGHVHPVVTNAAVEAMQRGASYGVSSPAEVELASELNRRVPGSLQWRFANSGTEAVMMAIRAARAWTGRDLLVRFEGSYHGGYDSIVSKPRGITAGARNDVLVLPQGDPVALRRVLAEFGDRISAVIFDAMPYRAGLWLAEPDFVQLLRAETEDRGILLILDEVITLRCHPGGLSSVFDVRPDLVVLGKVIGGGFPIGAFGGSAEIMATFDPRVPDSVDHSGTFVANPVSMAAGLAALTLLTPAEIDRINTLGDHLREGLRGLGWTVAGTGSLLRIHAADPPALWASFYQQGLLIGSNGLICMSTPMSEETVERMLERASILEKTL